MAKKKFRVESKGHFYAASIAEWKVDTDIEKLIRYMKAGGYSFNVIHVPLGIDEDYGIENFVPMVEGCKVLANYWID